LDGAIPTIHAQHSPDTDRVYTTPSDTRCGISPPVALKVEAPMTRIILASVAIILAVGTSSAVAGMMLGRAALARAVTAQVSLPVDDNQNLRPVPALRGSFR